MQEATPARRLATFAITFLGLLAFAQGNFAQGVLIAPPIALLLVLLGAGGGLMIWVDSRWSRVMFWAAAAIAVLATGAAALQAAPTGLLRVLVPVATFIGALAAVTHAAVLGWTRLPASIGRFSVPASLASIAVLALTTPPAGPAARLALTAAAVLIAMAWLLRPVPEET